MTEKPNAQKAVNTRIPTHFLRLTVAAYAAEGMQIDPAEMYDIAVAVNKRTSLINLLETIYNPILVDTSDSARQLGRQDVLEALREISGLGEHSRDEIRKLIEGLTPHSRRLDGKGEKNERSNPNPHSGSDPHP